MKEKSKRKKHRIYLFFKRILDILAAFICILLFAIPMLGIAIAVKVDSKGPALFKQKRLGKKGKVFTMLKFRSMVLDSEKEGVYSNKQDTRITKVGKFLRATSLDELPQLFNILKGDMSFVGPRPPLTYHPWPITEYSVDQKRMFDVLPGITGWSQINGRKTVEWNKRIELNVWYVDNVSIFLDIKILLITIFKVFKNSDNENNKKTVQ